MLCEARQAQRAAATLLWTESQNIDIIKIEFAKRIRNADQSRFFPRSKQVAGFRYETSLAPYDI